MLFRSELLQLRYFLTAARYQHMTQAADALRIAQPALSQSIKRLEQELGVSLFDREKRGIRLNDAGRFLQQTLTPVMAALDSLPSAVREQAAQTARTIRISHPAASSLVTEGVLEYRRLHPEACFRLRKNTCAEQPDDLCVCAPFPGSFAGEGSRFLLKETFFLAAASGSPYAALPCVPLEDVKHEDFIILSDDEPARGAFLRFCREAGFSPHIACECGDPESAQRLIAAGLGVSLWPIHSWGAPRQPGLTLLPVSRPDCRRDIVLICRPAENGALSEDFCRFLTSYAAQRETVL